LDPRELLPSARSILCVGLLYNTSHPLSTTLSDPTLGWISRYAWGEDYHGIVSDGLRKVEERLRERVGATLETKLCVDTAPLLERSYARMAGLGWIGKNTCLIHEGTGSWYFLGELLLSVALEPDAPPPDRCGSCTSCIDACPTAAIVPRGDEPARHYFVDARACISYYTIEKKGEIPEWARSGNGFHVFGCDICQDVCPWNRRAPLTEDPRFAPLLPPAPELERLAALSEEEFRQLFRHSPVSRTRYRGFLRNVVVAMGNAALPRFRPVLERLAAHPDEVIVTHANWALQQLPG
jgi:epoxyqueuosine reductase